ncbi:MAG: DUF3858 domain-containing protein [Planctomycetota bacterium]
MRRLPRRRQAHPDPPGETGGELAGRGGRVRHLPLGREACGPGEGEERRLRLGGQVRALPDAAAGRRAEDPRTALLAPVPGIDGFHRQHFRPRGHREARDVRVRRGNEGVQRHPGPGELGSGRPGGEWSLLAPENLSDYAALASREHDLVLTAPWRYESRSIYRLGAGLAFARVPESATLETPFGSVRLTYKLEGKKLAATKVIEIASNRVTPANYEAFRRFVSRSDRSERREIGVRVEP